MAKCFDERFDLVDSYELEMARAWAENAEKGNIWVSGPLTDRLTEYICSRLYTIEGDGNIETCHLFLNTPGGSIFNMFSLCDTILSMKTPVVTVGIGGVFSAGVPILACGHSDDGRGRLCHEDTTLMFHGCKGSIWWASQGDFEVEANQIKMLNERMCALLTEVTNKKLSHWQKIVKAMTDRYISIDEAIEWGIIDATVGRQAP